MQSYTPEIFKNNTKFFKFISDLLDPNYDITYYRYIDDDSIKNVMDRLTIIYNNKSLVRPLQNVVLQKAIEKKIYIQKDYITNIPCETPANINLNISLFFIKAQNDSLSEILAITHDKKPLISALENLLNVCGIDFSSDEHQCQNDAVNGIKSFDEKYSPEDVMLEALTEELNTATNGEKLSQREKQVILEKLFDRGVFLVKGSVAIVAQALDCSETTIYRHVSKMEKQ